MQGIEQVVTRTVRAGRILTLSTALGTLLSTAAFAQQPAPVLTPPLTAANNSGITNPVSSPGATNTPANTVGTPTNTVAVADDYRLDTGDAIAIEVIRHGDVSRTLQIPVDGKVRLPRLLTPVLARGMTVAELTEELTRKLHTEGKLVLRPGQVSVAIVGTRVRRVFLTGTAGKNGDFNLQNGWHVRELIAATGGIGQADRIKAEINNPLRPTPIQINLTRALREPNSADNVALTEGDTLVLNAPERKRLFVKGEGPRGPHEIDERFGLRQALVDLAVSSNGASGDLARARILRNEVPGDTTTPQTIIPVNLNQLLADDTVPDVALQDMDILDIPASQNFVYIFGQTNAQKKFYLPTDRKTYLADVMALGDTYGNAKIGSITVVRPKKPQIGGAAFSAANADPSDPTGGLTRHEYDFGKFLAKNDLKQNPEILPGDMIVVPNVKHTDVPGTIWSGWGFYQILQTLIPGIRPR